MQTALIILGCSGIALALLAGVFRIEDARQGKLWLAGSLRQWFTQVSQRVVTWCTTRVTLVRRQLRRLWRRYVSRIVLQKMLMFVYLLESVIEQWLRRSAVRGGRAHSERPANHLDEIAQHKIDVALTEAQKRRLRSHH